MPKRKKGRNWAQLEEIEFKYLPREMLFISRGEQKLILNQLKELTRLVGKLEKRMAKMEKKLDEENKLKNKGEK